MPITRISNATVWTGLRAGTADQVAAFSAIAFSEDGVLALGDAALEIEADVVIDGHGGFVSASFGDGHVHSIAGGFEGALAPVREHLTRQDLVAAVGAWAAEHPEVEWIEVPRSEWYARLEAKERETGAAS